MAHLYMLQGSSGLFKLGRTTNFTSRFQALKAEFSRRGERIVRMHFFPDTSAPVEAEYDFRRLISRKFRRNDSVSLEWYRDVDFDYAIRCGNAATKRANRGLLKTATQMHAEFNEELKRRAAVARAEAAERRRIHEARREVKRTGWMAALLGFTPAQRDAGESA